jgi:hypothetical protein
MKQCGLHKHKWLISVGYRVKSKTRYVIHNPQETGNVESSFGAWADTDKSMEENG